MELIKKVGIVALQAWVVLGLAVGGWFVSGCLLHKAGVAAETAVLVAVPFGLVSGWLTWNHDVAG